MLRRVVYRARAGMSQWLRWFHLSPKTGSSPKILHHLCPKSGLFWWKFSAVICLQFGGQFQHDLSLKMFVPKTGSLSLRSFSKRYWSFWKFAGRRLPICCIIWNPVTLGRNSPDKGRIAYVKVWHTGLFCLNLVDKGRTSLSMSSRTFIRWAVKKPECRHESIGWIQNVTFVPKTGCFWQENRTVWLRNRLFFPISSDKHGVKYFTVLVRPWSSESNEVNSFGRLWNIQ